MKIISLFSGAGGMDVGFEGAGFKITVAVESDSSCCDTLRKNMPETVVIQDLIENVSSQTILKSGKLKPLEAALVIGGPPCQPFSLAGKREGLNDKKGNLFKEFARVVRETLPTAFVLENVKGLLNWGNGAARDALLEEFTKPIKFKGTTYQYHIDYKLLNAVDYGVPQYRERVFFVGNRQGKMFQFPEPSHGEKTLLSLHLIPYQTVWNVIGNLPPADEPSETAKMVAGTIANRIINHGY